MDQSRMNLISDKNYLSEELEKAMQRVQTILAEVEKISAAPKQGEKSPDQGENSLPPHSVLEKICSDDKSDTIPEDEVKDLEKRRLKGKEIAQEGDEALKLFVDEVTRILEIDESESEAQRVYLQRMTEMQNIQFLNQILSKQEFEEQEVLLKQFEDEKRGRDEVNVVHQNEIPQDIVGNCLNDEAIPNSTLVPLLKLIRKEETDIEAREKVDAVINKIEVSVRENEFLKKEKERMEDLKLQKFLNKHGGKTRFLIDNGFPLESVKEMSRNEILDNFEKLEGHYYLNNRSKDAESLVFCNKTTSLIPDQKSILKRKLYETSPENSKKKHLKEEESDSVNHNILPCRIIYDSRTEYLNIMMDNEKIVKIFSTDDFRRFSKWQLNVMAALHYSDKGKQICVNDKQENLLRFLEEQGKLNFPCLNKTSK